MSELSPESSLVSSDSSSDDEFIQQVPADEIRLVKAYKRAKSHLRSVKNEKKKILVEEIIRKEEKTLLKKLILKNMELQQLERKDLKRKISFQGTEEKIKEPKIMDMKEAKITLKSDTSTATDKIVNNTAKNKKPKIYGISRFTMNDVENGYYINISVDIGPLKDYYMPIKKLLHKMKPIMREFSEYIPLQLFESVVRKNLEQQLTEMLEGKERLKSKDILNMYREKYPVEKDGFFIINTLVGIWRGDYNDCDTIDKYSEAPKKHDPDKEVPFEHISSGKGVWITVVETITQEDKEKKCKKKFGRSHKQMKKGKTSGNSEIVKNVNEIDNQEITDQCNDVNNPEKEVNSTELNEIHTDDIANKRSSLKNHDIIENSKDGKASVYITADDEDSLNVIASEDNKTNIIPANTEVSKEDENSLPFAEQAPLSQIEESPHSIVEAEPMEEN